MFLRRLEISGFKSFASRTRLDLEPGITAIVGPNGSGKSNVADAIRWALGEQSTKSLRLKKSEELVFAGTNKKAKASLAEVSLLLDNTDGGLAIDFSEVELARRLYRSGDSDYLLNQHKVRLNEVQGLLVAAGFGPNSYSVIGQGMIDSFILATPAERKLLFDEASGIRQYELKREQALRKLEATASNLTRVKDVLGELAPRLATLERGVAAASERQELESQLVEARAIMVASAEQQLTDSIAKCQTELDQLAGQIKSSRAALKILEATKQQTTKTVPALPPQRLHRLEVERDRLTNDLSVKRAELQLLLEKQTASRAIRQQITVCQAETNDFTQQIKQLKTDLRQLEADQKPAQAQLAAINSEITSVQSKLSRLRRQADQSARQEFIDHALGLMKQLVRNLSESDPDLSEVKLMVYKAGRLLSHASRGQQGLLEDIKKVQLQLNGLMKRREDGQENHSTEIIKLRSVELDLAHLSAQKAQADRRLQDLTEQAKQLQSPSPAVLASRQRQLQTMEDRLAKATVELTELRQNLHQQAAVPATDAIFELAAKLESTRTQLQASLDRQTQLIADADQAKAELARYRKMGRGWFGNQTSQAKSSPTPLLEQELLLGNLEASIAAHQSADHELIEEHTEVKNRHDFMAAQVADLESAQADLAQVITQLEQLIRSKFEVAFSNIAEHFGGYFQQLFGGGQASLQLTTDHGIYGIEIKAVPPGKRVEGLAMLSGGERAMTGIALLAAILRVNPSPFVVLDEVDAALDEANSARFASILKDISGQSQLLVITHNRQTMQAAHTLYGVTMDEYHVSKLLSVKLAEAKELAAT